MSYRVYRLSCPKSMLCLHLTENPSLQPRENQRPPRAAISEIPYITRSSVQALVHACIRDINSWQGCWNHRSGPFLQKDWDTCRCSNIRNCVQPGKGCGRQSLLSHLLGNSATSAPVVESLWQVQTINGTPSLCAVSQSACCPGPDNHDASRSLIGYNRIPCTP